MIVARKEIVRPPMNRTRRIALHGQEKRMTHGKALLLSVIGRRLRSNKALGIPRLANMVTNVLRPIGERKDHGLPTINQKNIVRMKVDEIKVAIVHIVIGRRSLTGQRRKAGRNHTPIINHRPISHLGRIDQPVMDGRITQHPPAMTIIIALSNKADPMRMSGEFALKTQLIPHLVIIEESQITIQEGIKDQGTLMAMVRDHIVALT